MADLVAAAGVSSGDPMSAIASQTVYLVFRQDTDVNECAGVFLTAEGARAAAEHLARKERDTAIEYCVMPYEVNRVYLFDDGGHYISEPMPLQVLKHVGWRWQDGEKST